MAWSICPPREKFDSIDELKKQIEMDRSIANALLQNLDLFYFGVWGTSNSFFPMSSRLRGDCVFGQIPPFFHLTWNNQPLEGHPRAYLLISWHHGQQILFEKTSLHIPYLFSNLTWQDEYRSAKVPHRPSNSPCPENTFGREEEPYGSFPIRKSVW